MLRADPPTLTAPGSPGHDVAAGSSLARVRARYDARQRERHEDFDIWPNGALVARVGVVGEDHSEGVRGGIRSLTALMADPSQGLPPPAVTDMADLVAAATRGLYSRGEDGELEPLPGIGGPLTFGAGFGAAIGVEEIQTPQGAVLVAFTEGEPPQINVMALMGVAMQIVGWLSNTSAAEDAASGS